MKFTDLQEKLAAMSRGQANLLADEAGIPRGTMAHLRKARTSNPRIETVEKLAAVLGKTRARRTPAPEARTA